MGRVRQFFKRNMSYPKGFGRKTLNKSVRTGGSNIAAKFTRWIDLSEGETSITSYTPPITVNTQTVLLLGIGDFNSDAANTGVSGKNGTGKVNRLRLQGTMAPDESATDPFVIRVTPWIAKCSPEVRTDWIANSRSIYLPNDNITSAHPYTVLGVGKQFLITAGAVSTIGAQAAANHGQLRVRCRYPITVKFPEQIYLFLFSEILHDGTTNQVPAADINMTYRFSGKMARVNIA